MALSEKKLFLDLFIEFKFIIQPLYARLSRHKSMNRLLNGHIINRQFIIFIKLSQIIDKLPGTQSITSQFIMKTDLSDQQWKYMKSFLCGGIAGMCSKTLIAPIERIKFMYITRSKKFTYRMFFSDFAYVVRKNGFLNLWRGNLMNVLRVFPHAAIDFAVFDFLRSRYYTPDNSVKQKIRLFLCGSIAGLCSLSATTPIQFIRVRLAMELDNFTYKSNFSAFQSVYQKQGMIGFYRGYGAALCGIIIYHGCSFFIFTRIKEEVKKVAPDSYSKWYVDFGVGAISSLGQLISYPFDVLRKRMQGQSLLFEKKQIDITHNYRQLIKQIYHKEGYWNGFYKGISLNFIKAPLSMATAWTIKNHLNRILDESYDL